MAKAKWERLLIEVDALIRQSNATLYDRAVKLVAIWDDPDFLAHFDGVVDDAEELLDSKLGDFGITFFDAKAMLKHFPSQERWSRGRIRELLAEAIELEQAAREQTAAPRKERHTPVPHKEHEQITGELNRKVEVLQRREESLADEVARLKSENMELRRQNAELTGRVHELERIVQRELATA